MKHVQIKVTYDRYSAVRTSSHCMYTCNPFLPHSKYRHYCKGWAYSCPWLQKKRINQVHVTSIYTFQYLIFFTTLMLHLYFVSLYFILTDLPTEIRKTSAMMKPAKENRNSLLLFHIIGVINKINQSIDLFVSPEQISLIYFWLKLTRYSPAVL